MPQKNESFFSGHIARPIEVKTSASGKAWGKLTLAVTSGKKPKETVAWVSITLFGDKANEAAAYGKGDIAEFEKLQYQTTTLENKETGEKKTFHGFTLPPWGNVTWTKKGQYNGGSKPNEAATRQADHVPTPPVMPKEPDFDSQPPF